MHEEINSCPVQFQTDPREVKKRRVSGRRYPAGAFQTDPCGIKARRSAHRARRRWSFQMDPRVGEILQSPIQIGMDMYFR